MIDNKLIPAYADGYEIRFDPRSETFRCFQNEKRLKNNDKTFAPRSLDRAKKFLSEIGAREVPKKVQLWAPPPAAVIAPLEEQLAALPVDAPRFVVVEKGYGTYSEQGYAVYDRTCGKIVCPHTYHGWNFVTQSRDEAEHEAVYQQEHPPVDDGPVLDMSLFRREFRENVQHLNEDEIADFNAKVEHGEIVLDPAPEPKLIPGQIDVDEQCEVGAIIEIDGVQRLCTWSGYISVADSADAEDGHDVFVAPGWHSTLLHLDTNVMRVLSEQYRTGHAQFPAYNSVKFAGETHAHYICDLRYSKELGLFDQCLIVEK